MLPQRPLAKLPTPILLRHFALIYLTAAALLTLVVVTVIQLDTGNRLESTKVRESARIEIAKNLVLRDFSSAVLDLHIIDGLPAMQSYLDSGSAGQRNELTRFFLLLSRESGHYDQIRYLDASGQEIIRINYNDGKPAAVPPGQLQNKSGRYFFNDTFKLGPQEVFISPLDLNIEHDQLEIPHKPMIRFGMPVFDSTGNKKGVILLNYFGGQMLQHFRDVIQDGDTRIAMLLNRDGYWLSGAKPEDEWGFMLQRPERMFASDFPAEWRAISTRSVGFLKSAEGLFVYDTVYPLQAEQHSSSGSAMPHAPSQRELDAAEYQWKIVTLVPADTLQAQGWFRQTGNRVLVIAAYLLLALAAYLVAFLNLRHRQSADSLKDNETRLREITATMSDGLMVTGQDGRILFANPEASLQLGYEQRELLGADMHDLLHVCADGSPAPREECPVLNIARSGKTYRGVEETFRRKDGSVMHVLVSASAVHRDHTAGDIVIAFHDITLRKELERELEHRAHTDVLTGLNNRRRFYELAEQEFSRAKRYGSPLAALMLDIDHFKKINDSYGHHIGDTVLQKLSEVCRVTLRENDIIGRMGGEEFAILLPETGGETALEVAERLRLAVASESMVLPEEGHFHFCVSIGVTNMVGSDENVDSMLKRSDAAMYVAKNSGRNRVDSYFVATTEEPAQSATATPPAG